MHLMPSDGRSVGGMEIEPPEQPRRPESAGLGPGNPAPGQVRTLPPGSRSFQSSQTELARSGVPHGPDHGYSWGAEALRCRISGYPPLLLYLQPGSPTAACRGSGPSRITLEI